MKKSFSAAFLCLLFIQCNQKEADDRIVHLDPKKAASLADSIKGTVSAQLDSGLTLSLWGIDSLVADPVSLDIDDLGRVYYTRTNRQKHSEFDIRGHQDWEISSIRLSTIEEKRAFLHKTLSPENSEKNRWLADLNGDGSHDWKDMSIEKEHVYRIEDSDGDGIADRSQLVVDDFNEEVTDAAGGVLKHGNDLFVGIGPDLWRIKEGKNGTAESKKSISHGYGIHIGFSGHGMSGIEVGPEGKIYWQIGDIGFNGVSSDGKKWEHPNSGVIVRSNPDGSDFEVFAYGNRNTHEFVFDEYGNLISEDNDGDHPGESERIVHVVEGADIGWRTNWQFGKYLDPDNNKYKVWMDEKMYVPRFEGQPAYILPTIRNFVNGPTGFLYNPGTALGNEYKNQFFVAEFVGNPTQSGIHSFRLRPKGSTFEFADSRMIVKGVLATGMDWGPDGSLYFGDWINGWGTKDYGRIWKLDVQSPDAALRADTKKWLSTDMDQMKAEGLKELLKHSDMRVRQKAQFALAEKGDAGLAILKQTIYESENQLARIHAIWGISQFARKKIGHAALLIPLLKDKDPEIRAQAARWLGDVRYQQAGPELLPLLKDEYSRARFFAAEALGRIAYAPAIESIIQMLAANNDQDHYLRHAGSLALARISNAKPIIALSGNTSRAVRMAAVLALRRMKDPGIAVFLNDADENIVTEAARAINDDLSITGALPDLARSLTSSSFTNEAFVRRAINANLRVGTNDCLDRLIQYTGINTAPVAMRAEAIATLGTWAKPSVLDRVDGRFRGEVVRDAGPVREKAAKTLIELFKSNEVNLRLEAAKACGKLNISEASIPLLTMLQKDQNSSVREEALKAICKMKGSDTENAIKTALSDQDKKVRMSGLSLIGQLPISKEVMVQQLALVIQKGSVEEKQTALAALSQVPFAYSQKLLEQLIGQMEKGKIPSDIQLELAEAIDSTYNEPMKSKWRSMAGAKNSDSTLSSFTAVLYGGDPEKGAGVFWGHPTAQCLRCHSYNDQGGSAGPRLNGVGNRLTREELLQALVQPSARIAPGYGQVSAVMKDSKKITGILMEENTKNYRIQISGKKDTLISKAQVASFQIGSSSMPPMHTILTKKEMRDLISFLASQKEN